jgi:uncharacterized membrane protein
MKKKVAIYLISLLIFLFLDSIWLGVIAQTMYQEQLGPIVNIKFNLMAAAIFYALYVMGILYFAILPAKNWKAGLKRGAILGGLCYATYDMTNLATIENWPISVTAIDIVWGMLITGATAGITTGINIRFHFYEPSGK